MRTYSFREKLLFFAALKNGKLQGVIKLRISRDIASIGAFVVARKFRGTGIGAELLQECERVARKHRCRKIWLWTLSEIPAYRFYRRHGYALEARLKGNWGGKADLCIMSKFLYQSKSIPVTGMKKA